MKKKPKWNPIGDFAKRPKAKTYEGSPHGRCGGSTTKYESTGNCVACQIAASDRWNRKHPKRFKKIQKDYKDSLSPELKRLRWKTQYHKNVEYYRQRSLDYYKRNRLQILKKRKEWRERRKKLNASKRGSR